MASRTRTLIFRRLTLFILSVIIAGGIVYYRYYRIEYERLPAFPYGEIRIAIDASFPPFALADENGLHGLEVDLGYALGAYLKAPVRFINMGIDGLYDSLEADQADIAISALIPEAWRLGDIVYTRPYFDAGLVLVVHSGSQIRSMNDLSGLSLAYEFGSAADAEVRTWLRRIDSFEIQPYEVPKHALDAVRLNAANAALVDSATARLYLQNYPDWMIEMHPATYVPYAIAVDFYKPETYTAIDRALGKLLESGKIEEIIRRWM